MSHQYLYYWKPEEVARFLEAEASLTHAVGKQLSCVEVGDSLWIVTAEADGLFLVGPIRREIEQAAIRLVRNWYEKRHYSITSVERDGCGYDLRCRKGQKEQHVEVKGTRGPRQILTITDGELQRARTDSQFVLWVVTDARGASPRKYRHSGREFLSRFRIRPTQYHAEIEEET